MSLSTELASVIIAAMHDSHPRKKEEVSELERINLARNKSTPVEKIAELARDQSPLVRNAVLFHPALPLSALMQLAADSDRFVAAQARSRLTALQMSMRRYHSSRSRTA